MAFVYRSDKKSSYIPQLPTENVGPGSYLEQTQALPELPKQKKIPFNTTITSKKGAAPLVTPGPGAYEVQNANDGQKIIFQSAENEIKIIEVPKPISVFKSQTKRYKPKESDQYPGPGAYEVSAADKHRIQQRISTKNQIIDHLMKINKYQSIPSIPGKVHSFGYTENEENELELNKNTQVIKEARVGPGSYEIPGMAQKALKHRKRALSQKAPQDPSLTDQAKKHTYGPGPGSYNLDAGPSQMYKLKPSQPFVSRTNRALDKKLLFEEKFKRQSQSFDYNNTDQKEDDSSSESEYEYVKDCTPGPGYYQTASTASTIQSQMKSDQSSVCPFGSNTTRFRKAEKKVPVGPGAYETKELRRVTAVQQVCGVALMPGIASVPDIGRQVRQAGLHQDAGAEPVQPEDVLGGEADNDASEGAAGVVRGERGPVQGQEPEQRRARAGVVQAEGEQGGEESTEHPLQEQHQEVRAGEQSVAQSPPPGSYDQNAYTIADRCKQEEEDDPELAIRKPPFGVGEKRWRDNVKVIEEEDEDFFNNERSTNDLFRKKPNNVPPFHSRERRFNYSADNNPGPGEYYDGMNPQWNKRTFNIIFAEI